MSKKKKSDTKKRMARAIIMISVISLLVLTFGVYFLYRQQDILVDSVISLTASSQKEMLAMAVQDISTEDELIAECEKLAHTYNGIGYWFVYSKDKVLLEKDGTQTEAMKGMTYANLYDYFLRKGGTNLKRFFAQIDEGKPFTAVVTKEKDIGDEIISVQFLTIEGNVYCIGKSSNKAFILSNSMVNQNNLRVKVLFAVIGLLTIVVSILSIINAQKKDRLIENLEKEVTDKNKKSSSFATRFRIA